MPTEPTATNGSARALRNRLHGHCFACAPVEVTERIESRKMGLFRLRAEIRQQGQLAAAAAAKFMKMPG